MNPRTIDALEEEKERLFRTVKKKVDTKYEGIKDSVKEEILDTSYYYLNHIVNRISQDSYSDPQFENSVDYQLVSVLGVRFNEWFEENFNENRINELNIKAK